jgi:hypothetical protein
MYKFKIGYSGVKQTTNVVSSTTATTLAVPTTTVIVPTTTLATTIASVTKASICLVEPNINYPGYDLAGTIANFNVASAADW